VLPSGRVGSLSFLRVARLLLVVALWAITAAPAQQPVVPTQAYPGNYPPALPKRRSASPPRLVFELVSEITLSDPVADGSVEIPKEGEPFVSAAPSPSEPASWALSSDGKHRYQTRATGLLVAEKRCRRCREGWKRAWSLRVPGSTRSLPRVHGRRLFFASSDGRVYCLRSDNGHRVWAVDVGDRVSRPLVVWSGVLPDVEGPSAGAGPLALELILVLPDGGGALLALDPYDGTRIGILELPPEKGRLATGVAAAPDGRIVVGRESYATAEITLMVLRLAPTKDLPPGPDPGQESSTHPVIK